MKRTVEENEAATGEPLPPPAVKRSGFDRRVGEERRTTLDLDYLEEEQTDRRSKKKRRIRAEARKGWVRISSWTSVCSLFADRLRP